MRFCITRVVLHYSAYDSMVFPYLDSSPFSYKGLSNEMSFFPSTNHIRELTRKSPDVIGIMADVGILSFVGPDNLEHAEREVRAGSGRATFKPNN